MQPWDSVLIKADTNNPDKGRAGVVQAVDNTADPKTVTIRLDADAVNAVKVVTVNQSDVQRLG
ncbi:hypothetical protein [Paraburkholderia rhynchosiae]|uniref:Hypervirulence associated protein TUDOR domain-containing protein n=1 Tax=Paraburkholderia rhynchosiae TaxID=487049 RepID=A0A2N7VU50_9BURK|nr:hypothetical protein [Paraburkholderia rhynchosiae]PMS20673.1 hypothetical protein C0Z16_34390 [Paraburkholderia rhynchosiae]CAB3726088.1 hypothetical protein LMG27174_05378 [Paraburkholderia rhynchosiae]